MDQTPRAQWGSRWGFILAAAGSAVGLGNIWKFPYITGENGGGLFVLIYLICIAVVGLPIMMAEIMIGRAGQAQPVVAFEKIAGRRTAWSSVGWLGVVAGFVILSFYIVVAGWAMDFTLKSIVNVAKPIHDSAEVEGSKYRATEDLESMRLMLVDRKAERDAKEEIRSIRAQAKPSAWQAYQRYTSALNAAKVDELYEYALLQAAEQNLEQPEHDPRYLEVHNRLIEDPEFAELIQTAQLLNAQIRIAKGEAEAAAQEHFAKFTPTEIRDEAEDMHRRDIIFSRVQQAFFDVATDGWTCTFWSAIFMILTILIVSGGISAGIERACTFLMPTLIGLILVMVVFGMFQPGFSEAFSFVFKPDPSKLKASGVLEALGHAFFTLSLGMGAMITYGSYQRTKKELAQQSLAIAFMDTLIALLACLMIFPIIFSYGQEPGAGPGLVFMSMPLAFSEIGSGGMLLAILFFGLLVFAALTSAISLLEVVASYFIDKRGWSRPRAAWTMGGAIFVFGLGSAFSLDPQFAMAGWEPSFGKNFFDTMDYLASNWLLPMGGLFVAIYAGWFLPKRVREAEIQDLSPLLSSGWLMLVRFVAPALVIVVLLQKVGFLDADELFHSWFN